MPNARPSSLSSTPAYQPRVHKFVRIFPVLNVCGLLEKYPRLNSPLTAYLIIDSFHRLVKRGISGGGGGEERERETLGSPLHFRFFYSLLLLFYVAEERRILDGIVAIQLFLLRNSFQLTTGCRERKSGSRSRYIVPFLLHPRTVFMRKINCGRKMLGHLSDSVDR